MKKFITLFLSFILVLGILLSCNDSKSEGTSSGTQSTSKETSTATKTPNSPDGAIFNTKNIDSITFYAYYGAGTGSEVPEENMTEFITWLGTFTIDKKVDGLLDPGTNTYCVEIKYSDGTIIKKGLDVIVVDGTSYYLKHAAYPDSFTNIISKTSIK